MGSYYKNKARLAKELYDKGLPFVKVYATCKDGNDFIVLQKENDTGITYHLAGGGVDAGESLEEAIKRELLEELNVEVEIIKELGVYDQLYVTWEYEGKKFDIQYEIHVFDTKCIRKIEHNFGLEGEFDKRMKVARIDKKTMLESVDEFTKFKIPFSPVTNGFTTLSS